MQQLLKALITAALITTITSCAGSKRYNIDTWVSMTERSEPQQQAVALKQELAQAVPDADQSWVFSGRLFSWNPASTSPSFAYGSRPWWEMNDVSSLRRGGVIEATVQFDMRPGVPVYRVILEPIDFPASALDAWQGYLMLDTGLNREEGSEERLFAPLDSAERTADGRLLTAWVYCAHCVADGPVEGDEAQLIRLREYASLYGSLDPATRWPEDGSYRMLAVRSTGPELFTGGAAMVRARQAAQAADEALAARARRAEQNEAYARFFREEHDPLSFESFSARSDCPEDYPRFRPVGNRAETFAKEAREAEAYARCQRRLLEEYDFEDYVRRHAGLVAREAALWAETSAIERREVLDPQDQLAVATARIEGAFANADKSWARSDRIAANDAEQRRQQAINRQIFMQTQASIDAWQRDVAGMAPIVRADGSLTTANAERERAAFAARAAAFDAEAERGDTGTQDNAPSGASRVAARAAASSAVSAGSSGGDAGDAPAPELPALRAGSWNYAGVGLGDHAVGHVFPGCSLFQLPGDTRRARCRVVQILDVPMLQSYCLPNRGSEAYTAATVITVVSVDGVTDAQHRRIDEIAEGTDSGLAAYSPSNMVHSAVFDAFEARRGPDGRQQYFRSIGAVERAHREVCGANVPLHWD